MDCRPGVALRVRIVGSDVRLSVSSLEGDRYRVRVDASGRFTVAVQSGVPHVLEGRYDSEDAARFSLAGVVAGLDELILMAGPKLR